MKKYLVFIFSSILIGSFVNAQYRINKTKYDYRTYLFEESDRYTPGGAGVASLFIPGLGQAISGEPARGLAFFGGVTACAVVSSIGILRLVQTIGTGISGEDPKQGGLFMMAAGSIGMVGVDIWSVVDAVRVAKVNNLAFRDKNKTSYSFQIQPCINTTFYARNKSIPVGLSLKVRF
jgi:hypothetical protein